MIVGRKTSVESIAKVDVSVYGRFARRAHKRSIQLWLTTHRRQLAALGVAGLAVAAVRGLGSLFKR